MTSRTPVPRSYVGAAEAAPEGVRGGQLSAEVNDDSVVVFLVGMRVNRWRRVRSWWPAFTAMPKMLAELAGSPGSPLLATRTFWSGRVFMVVQYWRSAADLGRFARDPGSTHQPAWADFNRRAARTADVGVFHETYVVPADSIETLYANMPAFGLGAAHRAVPRAAQRRSRAAEQMGQRDPEYADPAA